MSNKVTKDDLAASYAAKMGCSKAEASRAISAVFETIGEAIQTNGAVLLTGIGTIKTKQLGARNSRNPSTGEAIQVGPKTAVRFSAAVTLKRALNQNA